MDNPIVFQILLALVALFFIFLTYMNTKTWRWLHVTVTFLVFVAVIPFGVYAALTLKTREAWIKKHDQLETDLKKTKEEIELATRGPINDVQQTAESVANLKGQVTRTILDRGRVWRDGITIAGQPQGGTVTLNMAGAPPADPTGAAAAPVARKHNISEKTVLFAFAQAENPEFPGIPVPAFYIGEFTVTAAAEATITLLPTLPLANDQIQVASNPQTQWILYEVMPSDDHLWFKNPANPAESLTKDQLAKLIPQQATGLAQAQYDKLLDQFLRDGKEADEVNDPPDNIWIRVKFTKAQTVEVDAPAELTLDRELPFDSQGRAVAHRLRRAGSSTEPGKADFAAGEEALFDKQSAEKLIADGAATLVARVYRRSLVDFDTKFRLIYARYADLNTRIAALTQDMQAVQASKAKADAQATLVEQYKSKLTDDLAKVTFERDEVKKYRELLEGRLGEVRGELSQLYVSNRKLSAELTALNAQMTEEIDRRAREATALNR
jgi:hypothetical protein